MRPNNLAQVNPINQSLTPENQWKQSSAQHQINDLMEQIKLK